MANAQAVLDALGDPTRRHIFEIVAKGPRSVVDVAREVPVSRPAVSQHLKVLKRAALVSDRAEGTRRVYAVDPQGIAALRGYLDQFWDGALDRFKAAAECAAMEATQSPAQRTHTRRTRK